MRIMIVNTYYYPEILGGAEYSVKKLAEELVRYGHKVCVFCTGFEDQNEIIEGVQVRRIRTQHICRALETENKNIAVKLIRRIQDSWNNRNAQSFRQAIIDFQPEVIHTNGLYDLSPIVWQIASEHGIKVVHTLRDYFSVCPIGSLQCKFGNECNYPSLLCKYHRWRYFRAANWVKVVTAPSLFTLKSVLNENIFCNATTIHIPNAIDFDPKDINKIVCMRKKRTFNSNTPIKFVYLGTLSLKKGVQLLLDAFHEIDGNIELHIAGKGELQQEINTGKDSRVIFHGFLSEQDTSELLNDMDILICPSLWQEPFGRVVLDAYKNAMPVIASDSGALKSIVSNQKTGIVFKSGDKEMLKNAMLFYMLNPRKILEHSVNAAVEIKKYSIASQIDSFIRIYKNNIN